MPLSSIVALAALLAAGQQESAKTTQPDALESIADRVWISGQANFIVQAHPAFRSPYSGDNSLRSPAERATSRVLTLFTGFRLARHTEILLDIESAGGRGISDAFGVAGFTNLDVVRNPTLGSKPYLARVELHQTIPLSHEYVENEQRGPLNIAASVPARRIEIRAGKMSTVDTFDQNGVGSDSHLQFMNWTADNQGAYDYAADTRGYTFGLTVEYIDRDWALRFGEVLMPTVANGIKLDWSIPRARGENFELELHPRAWNARPTILRFLGYVNHANMGVYSESIQRFIAGVDPVPDITATRRQNRVKYGVGLSAEQQFKPGWRGYARAGWNDGKTESFAYTEVEGSLSFGTDLKGAKWRRPADKVAAAYLVNSIAPDHRNYLRLGGQGFLLGDGTLTYGTERIFETYYSLHLYRGSALSVDYQRLTNPGYNRDRGPISVTSLRFHIEDIASFRRTKR